MNRDELGTRIRAQISDHMQRHVSHRTRGLEVTDDSRLLEGGLCLDSLDLVEITMALEDELDIEIPDEEVDAVTTVGQLIDFLAGKLGIVEAEAA